MIYCCILKGRTTSEDQFERFLLSYKDALVMSPNNITSYFFYDTDDSKKKIEGTIKDYLSHHFYILLKRNDDAGQLRNEFLARISVRDPKLGDCFTFFDGDDTIDRNYFNFDPTNLIGRGYGVGNPVAVYGPLETDKYPLKWCQVLSTSDPFNAILLDKKGCQSWGNFYEMQIARETCFGSGLFEDVVFWYRIANKYKNPLLMWDKIYYWHRDNPKALTRNTNTMQQLKEGFKNLETAKNCALKYFCDSDERVWRRYTIGILILLRNSQKIENKEKEEMLDFLFKSKDPKCFYANEIRLSEPKLWENVKESYKYLEEFCGLITSETAYL